jgi:hypothetical protein
LAISAVPFIKDAIPSPEPPPEIETNTSLSTFRNDSANNTTRFTSVSDPLILIVDVSCEQDKRKTKQKKQYFILFCVFNVKS